MKKFLLLLFLTGALFAQSVRVEKIIKLKTEGDFAFPKFSPDDSELLLTTPNYKGLFLYDLTNGTVKTLSNENGAGFKAKFSAEGDRIFFRTYKLVEGKKYSSQKIFDFKENKTITLVADKRNLTPPIKSLAGNVFCFSKGERLEIEKSLMKNSASNKAVFIRNSEIVFDDGQNEKVLKPLGEGIYVWPALSPDGKFIAFTFGGKGSFVMDTEGNIVKRLGDLHYPRWSPDGKWIVGMNDKDNGYDYTSSDIVIISMKNLKKFNITNSKEKIEMYPEWSHNGKEITFNDLKGNIYIVKLVLAEG